MPFDGQNFKKSALLPTLKQAIFSLEGLIYWLKTKPAEEEYDYYDHSGACLLGQYLAHHNLSMDYYFEAAAIKQGKGSGSKAGSAIAAACPHTFGAALSRAKRLLAKNA